MPVKVIGLPQTSLLDAVLLADAAGIELDYFLVNAGPTSFRTVAPRRRRYSGDVSFLYLNSLETLNQSYELLSSMKVLVLLSSALTELTENEVEVHGNGIEPFRVKDLRKAEETFDQGPFYVPSAKTVNLARDILLDKNRGSVLQKLQNAFYRIKDKDARSQVQKATYAYLTGKRGYSAVSEFAFITSILDTPLVTKFRLAVKEAARSGDPDEAAAKFQIDRFEIAFVLSKMKGE